MIRRDQPFSNICCDVCYAALSTIMGRCVAYGAKPPILHITEWWFSYTIKSTLAIAANHLIYTIGRNMKPFTKLISRSLHILLANEQLLGENVQTKMEKRRIG